LTAADVIAGAKGKPAPFEYLDYTYLLRPLTQAEVNDLIARRQESGSDARLLALVICDGDGKPVLSEADVPNLPFVAIQALFKEILDRNGLGDAGGKAEPVTTPA
jgi:hypothetical protein